LQISQCGTLALGDNIDLVKAMKKPYYIGWQYDCRTNDHASYLSLEVGSQIITIILNFFLWQQLVALYRFIALQILRNQKSFSSDQLSLSE